MSLGSAVDYQADEQAGVARLSFRHELLPARLLCPWDSPGETTGVGCHGLLQGIFLTQGSYLRLLQLLHCRQILYREPPGKSSELPFLRSILEPFGRLIAPHLLFQVKC